LWFNNDMWNNYILPATLAETLHLLAEKRQTARLVAGATDLMLELERSLRKGIETVIDITRLPDLDRITLDENDTIHLGPLVTHNAVAGSKLLRERAFPLVSAAWQVGAPQIRNRATVAGNLVTASPANDTITPLVALAAWVTLASEKGSRRVRLQDFYTGVRRTILDPDEMLVDISFPALKSTPTGTSGQCGTFLKLGLRRVQAISLVNVAILLDLGAGQTQPVVGSCAITLGAVAPTIIHATEAEAFLAGKELTDEAIAGTAELAAGAARPIDDIRGSAAYRKAMVRVLITRGLRLLRDGQERSQVPESPVLLWGNQPAFGNPRSEARETSPAYPFPIHTRINGKEYTFHSGHDKSLLRLLREEAGLTGTKEGCAEGECGACTVFLDGKAVMACLVPAPRADGAEIVTIEGLATPQMPADEQASADSQARVTLHPVQAAFVADGAVQCGYCTPGFIMSAAKLLEERPQPGRDEIMQALTGNLCRCTGYYKIVQAVEDAARQ
jgi:xanthine dehydrogenase iron-sulfur cluster and FAD-binding subunit A